MSATDVPSEEILVDPYVAYSYSYPHKSAYGELTPAVSLDEVWQQENRENLFLYMHLPFCEMRCGFCNLFAHAGAGEETFDAYLDSVQRQTRRLAGATYGKRNVARMAFGGGTPTVLSVRQLGRLFRMLATDFDADPLNIPTSVETSPKTATQEKLQLLRSWGVERISIGVQSFLDTEVHAIGRPQQSSEVHAAISLIKQLEFPTLNIDLIYGQPGQTLDSWTESLDETLRYAPDEVFLYPLYVRPQTGLGRREKQFDPQAALAKDMYRAGRDRLLEAGYRQESMRCFSLKPETSESGPSYCCQSDGMLGLGAGARSYTSQLHYSSRFAVQAAGVRAILDQWMQRTEHDFGFADWGIWLTEEERQRRYVIQSLLHYQGLDQNQFTQTFGKTPQEVVPRLKQLAISGYVEEVVDRLRLTPEGMAMSDAIGPALYSDFSREKLAEFTSL